jgi:hypothetical protein
MKLGLASSHRIVVICRWDYSIMSCKVFSYVAMKSLCGWRTFLRVRCTHVSRKLLQCVREITIYIVMLVESLTTTWHKWYPVLDIQSAEALRSFDCFPYLFCELLSAVGRVFYAVSPVGAFEVFLLLSSDLGEGFIPSTQRYYRRFLHLFLFLLNCYNIFLLEDGRTTETCNS